MAKGKKDKLPKTNALRILEQKNVPYTPHSYHNTQAISGVEVAAVLGQDPAQVFKTLVTVAKSGEHYVFVLPVEKELDLKKAAKAVNEKNIAMIRSKELLPLTGYIHGGCSPVGMKKFFTTTFDQQVQQQERVFFSGGQIGLQVEMAVEDLDKLFPYQVADLTLEE